MYGGRGIHQTRWITPFQPHRASTYMRWFSKFLIPKALREIVSILVWNPSVMAMNLEKRLKVMSMRDGVREMRFLAAQWIKNS